MKLKSLFFGVMAFAMIFSSTSFAATSDDRNCLLDNNTELCLDAEASMAFNSFMTTTCSDCNVSIGSLNGFALNPCRYGMSVSSASVYSPCYINFYRWFFIGPNGNWYSIDTPNQFHLADFTGWGSGNVTVYVRAVASYPENPNAICFSNISTFSISLSGC